MRLLDRYLLRELLIPFSYCLSGFFVFWMSFDLLTDLERFQRYKLGFLDVAQYYFIQIPEVVVLILPITFLLALLYALTNHTRHSELTAMRAAGVSLWRLTLPYLGVGLVLSLVALVLNEGFVPESAVAADAVLRRYVRPAGSEAARRWETKVGITNTREQRRWLIGAFNPQTYELISPHVEWTLPDGARRLIIAERGSWTDGGWLFTNVEVTVYPPGRGANPDPPTHTDLLLATELTETPEQIKSAIKVNKITSFKESRKAQFSIREILNYKRLHSDAPDKMAMMDTTLHARLAAPWTCLVVVLIALPFGARTGRRNVYVGVASSIVICFAYYVLQQLALAVGTRGTVAPWIAAWTPNALFALGGITLTWRIR